MCGPKIEQSACAGQFLFVRRNDARLGLDRMDNRIFARRGVAFKKRIKIGIAIVEKLGVVDQAIFDDLCKPSRQLSPRQALPSTCGSISTSEGW